MHIILGMLGTIVTILILLNRLAQSGIDLAGLNPFLWRRRTKWKQKMQGDPIYHIESPLDVTALLATTTAKADGDMSSEEKKLLLNLFQSEFKVNKKNAAELLISSAYLLGNGEVLQQNLRKVLTPSFENFTQDQAESATILLDKVCAAESAAEELKIEFVSNVKKVFSKAFAEKGKWD